MIKRQIRGKYETFWLSKINEIKIGSDNQNHNKLRFYSALKGCFKKESYIDLVPNRSQRADLTRLRISSSRLAVEVQRYKRPKVPENERYCMYCRPAGPDNNTEGYVDNEQHLLINCTSFVLERNCLFSRIESIKPGFQALTPSSKAATLLCPTSVLTAKLVNKFIQLVFQIRKQLDEGVPALNLGFEQGTLCKNIFFDIDSDNDD